MQVTVLQDPNWYAAMMKYRWTVNNIAYRFKISSTVARHIQCVLPSYQHAVAIANASRELTTQLGH